jgi:hypothetical protein
MSFICFVCRLSKVGNLEEAVDVPTWCIAKPSLSGRFPSCMPEELLWCVWERRVELRIAAGSGILWACFWCCNMRWEHASFYTFLHGVVDETKRLDMVLISFCIDQALGILAFKLLFLVIRDLDQMCEEFKFNIKSGHRFLASRAQKKWGYRVGFIDEIMSSPQKIQLKSDIERVPRCLV